MLLESLVCPVRHTARQTVPTSSVPETHTQAETPSVKLSAVLHTHVLFMAISPELESHNWHPPAANSP